MTSIGTIFYRNAVWLSFFLTALFFWPIIALAHLSASVASFYYSVMFNVFYHLLLKHGDDRMRQMVFTLLEEEQRRRGSLKILEVGPGNGGNFRYYPSGSVVTTLELNPYLLEQADSIRKKYSNLTINDMKTGNVEDMKDIFPDNTFDAVILTHVICCVKQKEKALNEINRVLKTGGKVYTLEMVYFQERHWFYRLIQSLYHPLHAFVALGCSGGAFDCELLLKNHGFDTSALKYDIEEAHPVPYMCSLIGAAVKK
jgi:ubiquinone/menaquinone biosynthesis C-methylase UbiE